jgi:hypothetical protein
MLSSRHGHVRRLGALTIVEAAKSHSLDLSKIIANAKKMP